MRDKTSSRCQRDILKMFYPYFRLYVVLSPCHRCRHTRLHKREKQHWYNVAQRQRVTEGLLTL